MGEKRNEYRIFVGEPGRESTGKTKTYVGGQY
jgi:hypothetical protein